MSRDGDVIEDGKCRIDKALKAFSCFRGPIFILSISTKRALYWAVVLVALLYGVETWTLKAEHMRRLATFHNHCVRTILGVTRYQQWEQRLTSITLANRFGMDWTILHIIMDKKLQWLSHFERMCM